MSLPLTLRRPTAEPTATVPPTVPATVPPTVRAAALTAALASVLTIVLALVAPGVASAHSGLAAASPGPDAVVGGDITEIQLFYGDFIVTFDGEVTGPDGAVVDAAFEMLTEIEARIVFAEPLTAPGEYRVAHTVLSIDDDVVDDDFRFTFDPSAPEPSLVFVEEDEGVSWVVWAIGAAGVIVIGVLVWQLLGSIRRARAAVARAQTKQTES